MGYEENAKQLSNACVSADEESLGMKLEQSMRIRLGKKGLCTIMNISASFDAAV